MSARDELIDLIRRSSKYVVVTSDEGSYLADAILAAGWRPPMSEAEITAVAQQGTEFVNKTRAAARREALEEAAQVIRSSEISSVNIAHPAPEFREGFETGIKVAQVSLANAVAALLDQPAPPAHDYRALCAKLVEAGSNLRSLAIPHFSQDDPSEDLAIREMGAALKGAEEMGVKP